MALERHRVHGAGALGSGGLACLGGRTGLGEVEAVAMG